MPRLRHSSALLTALLALSGAAAAQSSSWLDRPMEKWNVAAASVPAPASAREPRQALLKRCAANAAAATQADAVIQKSGWVPFLHLDRRITRDDIEVIGGMADAGPACEPTSFNLFVFSGGRFAGTISPSTMTAARDGVAGAVRIASADSLTTEFARFTAADSDCCPSSIVRVTYRITRSGAAPVLEPVEVRKVR